MQHLAQTLRDFSRTDDVACRIGGDEFMMICPNTGAENALNFAQTTNTNEMETITDLVKVADEALYAAKAADKNCVRQRVSA